MNKTMISVCCGTGCSAQGAREVLKKFQELLPSHKAQVTADSKMTGCHGFCERGPLVVIRNNEKSIFYQKIKEDDVKKIVEETVIKGKILEEFLYEDPLTKTKIIEEEEIPFYKYQKRIIFENNGKIDPTNIADYTNLEGYNALEKAVKMSGDEIIEEIKKSGLRGRGGGGFPTWRKWDSCRKSKTSDTRYIICNADEGDPGCFQDRSILEGNPHLVIEGMIIGGFAIKSSKGFIYVRAEYPLAVKHLEIALEQAKEKGFLGKNILNSGFNFDIEIVQGAGAFVCGESSALMASIEGRLGEPRVKHIHATDKGLWDKPTALNNVKTWASVTLIIKNGGKWFSSIGTVNSKGTMIFSLVGKVKNTGLVEVPMGISLRDLIFKIGGGIINDRKFKAVQTGGPSGGNIPEKYLDLPVDYEALTKAGSIMGSGGMVVMDEDTCMVQIARYFLSFTQEESCGKCTPCREGTNSMLKILDKFISGKAEEKHLDELEKIALMVKETSLCGLGKSAPNPVLTTLKYFRDEYRAHIKGTCPAKVCPELIKYEILDKECTGCTVCAKNCPQNAITGETKKPHKVIQDKCIKCGICLEVCKFNAVIKE
ncbi:MAG: NADH-quinone oxidoreductase subunit NuoF [bacterium]